MAEASRETKISQTQIRRLLRDPKNTDWSYASKEKEEIMSNKNIVNINKAKKVQVNGKFYRSIKEAATAEKICRRTLSRHLVDPNKSYCFFVDDSCSFLKI